MRSRLRKQIIISNILKAAVFEIMTNTDKDFVASYGRRPWLDLEVINDAGENLIQLASFKESLPTTEMFFFHFKQKKKAIFFEKLGKKFRPDLPYAPPCR